MGKDLLAKRYRKNLAQPRLVTLDECVHFICEQCAVVGPESQGNGEGFGIFCEALTCGILVEIDGHYRFQEGLRDAAKDSLDFAESEFERSDHGNVA